MLPSATETAYALYGAWRLLRGDRGGHQYFELSERAFWQSFFAAVIVAPGHAVLVLLHLRAAELGADILSIFLIHALAYAMSWTAFPLAAFYLSQGLDREERWLGFVVALNWSKVLQMAIYLPMALLAASGLAGPGGGAVFSLVGLGAVLVYQWWVTRTAFDIAGMPAAGLTGVDVVLGILITVFADAALAG